MTIGARMVVERGDVVWVNFGASVASSMTKVRPAVVIQNDSANRAAPHTIVAAVRHDTGKRLPIHVPLPAGGAGLTKDSLVDLGHIASVPLTRLERRSGKLNVAQMARVDEAIRISLGLRWD